VRVREWLVRRADIRGSGQSGGQVSRAGLLSRPRVPGGAAFRTSGRPAIGRMGGQSPTAQPGG
jgi:hypothetical protein